jgi:hypothetical protein
VILHRAQRHLSMPHRVSEALSRALRLFGRGELLAEPPSSLIVRLEE